MPSAMVIAKAQALLPLATDAKGVIDADKLQLVAQSLLNSAQPSKREIVRQLAVLAEKLQSQQLAEVVSAVELPSSTQEQLIKLVQARHPEVKKFNWSVNSSLLGGFTIKVADTWYDTSVSADLQTIREQLSR